MSAPISHLDAWARGELRVIAPDDPQRQRALALALSGQDSPTEEVRKHIDLLTDAAARQGLCLDLLVAACAHQMPVVAALAIESPGRSAIVQAALDHSGRAGAAALVEVLQLLVRSFVDRGGLLIQAVVDPDDRELPAVYRSAGFRYLTDLIYMDAPVGACTRAENAPPELRLETYSANRHDLFIRALDSSYVDSSDCPGLSGLRPTADILAGHRATGTFDPQGWYVALRAGNPIGVLLTAQAVQRSALEIVYVGVCPAGRGRGVGKHLMHVADERARQLALPIVTLAVDATNEPARRMYERCGFRATHRRRVWIASPRIANTSA
jgi:ribosomal protein S18 acetylase RimI-like enzyme